MSFLKKLFSGKNKRNNKKNKKIEGKAISDLSYDDLDEKQINYDSILDRTNFIKENCEQIVDTTRQLDEMKVEYQAVTSYLSDMQRIEILPHEEREELNAVARKIITLTREKANIKNSTRTITDVQFKNIEKYEDEMPSVLKKMMRNETYSSTIKKDMHYLEGEKGSLSYQKEETLDNQIYLKKIAITTCVMVTILFLVFAYIQNIYEADIQIPFLLTIVMALISAIYIFTKAGSNRNNMKLIDKKLNKAITLLNKVKIKYINNTSELEYSYQKFMVNSYAELNYLWNQYIKAKEEEKHYLKNTQELDYYNDKLVKFLKKYDIADPDIWIYQTIAIIDNKEMSEVRHRLNVRREKLRERIDYNNKLKERCIKDLSKLLEQKPESREEVLKCLRKYNIEL